MIKFDLNNKLLKLTYGIAILSVISGCSSLTPIGSDVTGYEEVYSEVNKTSLTSNDYGSKSRIVLRRYGLEKIYNNNPRKALNTLHKYALTDKRRDILYALTELNYLQGKEECENMSDSGFEDGADSFLQAALYSFYYLTDKSFCPQAGPFDGGFKKINDYYNLSVSRAFTKNGSKEHLILNDSTRKLYSFGDVKINIVDKVKGVIDLNELTSYTASDALSIRGFSMRVRDNGIGAPIIGEKPINQGDQTLTKSFGLTLVMMTNGGLPKQLGENISIDLQIYSPLTSSSFQFNGNTIPLEMDLTAPIAQHLNQSFYWDLGFTQFLTGKQLIKNGMYQTQPYQKGKIPVVLVHGTMSSPITWVESWNTLKADPEIRDKYQFWYYSYDSGKPVLQSAKHLCKTLTALRHKLDPENKDIALQNIVVMGHSQGGLLTRLTVTNTGDKLIKALTKGKSLREIGVSDKFIADIESKAIFAPLPFVSRVIYISTPHRGSSLVNGFTSRLANWFITLPAAAITNTKDVFKGIANLELGEELRQIKFRTSIQSMSPQNPSLLALADIDPPKYVTVNSIVAVNDIEDMKDSGDGVVDYSSAHLENANSEFVVEDSHSCLENPLVIEEVRKRLLEHSKKVHEKYPILNKKEISEPKIKATGQRKIHIKQL